MAHEHTLKMVTLESPDRFLTDAVAAMKIWSERARSRRQLLLRMEDPGLLDDIGISRAQAIREVQKQFWQA